jgi:hypothetical protein
MVAIPSLASILALRFTAFWPEPKPWQRTTPGTGESAVAKDGRRTLPFNLIPFEPNVILRSFTAFELLLENKFFIICYLLRLKINQSYLSN